MQNIHIHAPPVTERFMHAGTCPDCKRRTRFIGWCYEWYGSTKYCLRCGREWQDGEWMALPFQRDARQHNINFAKKMWRKLAA